MSQKENNESNHYVDKAEFSQAVMEYVQSCEEAHKKGEPDPVVPNYIAECFMKISEKTSHNSYFINYPFREEMVMDGVENCLRAAKNYDITAPTRSGKPNAFGYFTQIVYWAFLRRIKKEKKDYQGRLKYIFESGLDQFIADDTMEPEATQAIQSYVEDLRKKLDDTREKKEESIPEKTDKPIRRSRATPKADSDLMEFLDYEDDY